MGSCICKKTRRSTHEASPTYNDVDTPYVVSIQAESRIDFSQYYLDPPNCTVEWKQSDPTVGVLNIVEIQFVCQNGSPYRLKQRDDFHAKVAHKEDTNRTVNCIIEPPLNSLVGVSTICVSFNVQVIGTYNITFTVNGQTLHRVYTRDYQAGPPNRNKTVFHLNTNVIILKCNTFFPIMFSPRDCYNNIACFRNELLFFEARKEGSDTLIPEYLINPVDNEEGKYEMLVKLDEPGYYNCCVKYIDRVLGLKDTTVICLTDENMYAVEKNMSCQFLTYGHKAHLLPSVNSTKNSRKVKVFISPRLLQIREKKIIITSRVFTCRVCNNTQLTLHSQPQVFTIDDGLQPPVTLSSPNRDTIAAVFCKFVQRNIRGTILFQDKVNSFHQELQNQNPNHQYENQISITVNRFNLLQSTMHATKGFSTEKWKRSFNITFEGESGIDVGGVCREFFNCLCDVLFGGRNPRGLFTPFKDDPQSLVHPNSSKKRDRLLTLEYYQFAGRVVGKCLYDTAIGNRLLVKAKFTRSFLAQIIGLRISWKHFETDDPDLYAHKIAHIRDHDITELDLSLTFTQETFEDNDPRVVSIIPGGSKTKVTDGNKMDYLNQLAQYILGKCVAEEIESFLKGLHELIPDDLLSMFDENELELLMCGVQKLSVDDLRAHAQVRNSSSEFERVLNWFWATVEEFNQEELARLVQFVTGSSQIPTGGFSELRPPFILAPSGETGNRLPYAHTCFNHLCLPLSDTYEQFRTALMTAINEGCEGVLLE